MILVALRVPVVLTVLTVLVRIGTAIFARVAMRAVVARGSRDRRGRTVPIPVSVSVSGIGEGS
jgi:hypothetical protein